MAPDLFIHEIREEKGERQNAEHVERKIFERIPQRKLHVVGIEGERLEKFCEVVEPPLVDRRSRRRDTVERTERQDNGVEIDDDVKDDEPRDGYRKHTNNEPGHPLAERFRHSVFDLKG